MAVDVSHSNTRFWMLETLIRFELEQQLAGVYYTESGYLNKIVDHFCNVYDELKKEGIVSNRDLSHPAKGNLHSWLQYALVLAGEQEGFRSPTEIKIGFDPPLYQKMCGIKEPKKRALSRVDVAFYRNNFRFGFAEVKTINDANVFLPTKVFTSACEKGVLKQNEFTVMYRDVLMHTLKHSSPKPKFVVLIVTLPKKASCVPYLSIMEKVGREDEQVRKMAKILSRKEKNFDEACKQGWIEFRDSIRDETSIDCSLIVIDEEGARSVDD